MQISGYTRFIPRSLDVDYVDTKSAARLRGTNLVFPDRPSVQGFCLRSTTCLDFTLSPTHPKFHRVFRH